MTLVLGNDIIVKINTVDYTQYILSYSESGGKKVFNKTKTYGNNYITTLTGRENYTVDLEFKYDVTFLNFDTLFEADSSVTLEITLTSKKITYSNAYPVDLTFSLNKDEIVTCTLSYEIAAADTNVYNKVIS